MYIAKAVLSLLMLLFSVTLINGQALDRTHVNYTNPLQYGATCTSTTLNSTITAVGSAKQTLFITKTDRAKAACTWVLSANVTFAANTVVYIPNGVIISPNTGITVTFNGLVIIDDPDSLQGLGSFVFAYPQGIAAPSKVTDGCKPDIPVSGLTVPTLSCNADIVVGSQLLNIVQPTSTIGPLDDGDGTYWLLFDYSKTRTIAGWTRQGTTRYLWQKAATKPAAVNGSFVFAELAIADDDIWTVNWRRPIDTSSFMFNAAWYGADLTGIDDSYPALLGLSKDVNEYCTNGNGAAVLYPPGIYLVDKAKRNQGGSGGVSLNGIEDFLYTGCKGLQFSGHGATINLKGDVFLDITAPSSTPYSMVKPFYITNSSNVSIEGFTVDGNADLLTWDVGSTSETDSRAIDIQGCENVSIRNLVIHHSWTDGISVRRWAFAGPDLISQNVTIENVIVYASGRCNIALHEMRNITVRNSKLYDGGITGEAGTVSWSPACNFAIEPDLTVPDVTREAGYILLENSDLRNALLRNAYANVRNSHVTFRQNYFDNPNGDQQPVIMSVPFGVLEYNYINTGVGRIDVAISGTTGNNVVYVRGNDIHTTAEGLIGNSDSGGVGGQPKLIKLIVEGNNFWREGGADAKRTPTLSHGDTAFQIIFRDNYVNIHNTAYTGSGQDVKSDLHVQLSENNIFETPLSHATNFFAVLYGNTGVAPRYNTVVRGDRFISPNNLSMRPADYSLHDNTVSYNSGREFGAMFWGVVGSSTLTVPLNSVEYMAPLGVNGMSVTEENRTYLIPQRSILRNLTVRTLGTQPSNGSLVVTVRKNGTDTTLDLTIAASAAAGVYTSVANLSVAVAAGDRVSVSFDNNSADTSSAIIGQMSMTADLYP